MGTDRIDHMKYLEGMEVLDSEFGQPSGPCRIWKKSRRLRDKRRENISEIRCICLRLFILRITATIIAFIADLTVTIIFAGQN